MSTASIRTLKSCAAVALLGLMAACSGGSGGDNGAPVDAGSAGGGGSSGGGGTGNGNGGQAAAPVAEFTATPVAGSTVEFDASASTVSGANATYYWTFGSLFSSPASGVRVTHQFASASYYEVTLTVTDELGRQATTTKTIEVRLNAMPNLVGLPLADAIAVMAANGPPLTNIRQSFDSTQPAGTVINQYSSAESRYVEIASSLNVTDVFFGIPPTFLLYDPASQYRLPTFPDLARIAVVGTTSISDYELAEVVVRIGGVDTRLSYAPRVPNCPGRRGTTPCPGYWGDVSFAGQPVGVVTFEIRARDVLGNEFVRVYAVVHDNPPQLTVTQPVDGSVAFGTLPIDASCSDDSFCMIEVRVDGTMVSFATGVLTRQITLTTPVNSTAHIDIVARDERQTTSAERTIHHEDPARLNTVTVVPGEILDACGTRVMYVTPGTTGDRLLIRDTATGNEEEIPALGRSVRAARAFLLSNGAVFESSPAGGGTLSASLWRLGALTDLGAITADTLSVSGDFAIFNTGSTLRRLEATSGAIDVVTTTGEPVNNAVGTDGTVVFWGAGPAHQLFRYRSGSVTALSNAPTQSHAWPLTDGDNTVFRKSVPNQNVYNIALLEGTTETSLASGLTSTPQPHTDYAIANGWVAFTSPGAQLQKHVHVRSPDGTAQQRTIFSTSSRIDTLRGNGDIMVVNQTRRYFSDGVNFIPISYAAGESYLLNDRWHVAIRGTLLEVNTDN
jgi:PKD repeat protein